MANFRFGTLALAARAIEGSPLALHDPADGGLADPAGRAGTAVDFRLDLKIAKLAIRPLVIPQ